LAEPFRNKTKAELTKTYQKFKKNIKKRGLTINMHIIDNEASEMYQQAIKEAGSKYQIVPPCIH